ncbi:coadhesin-like [Branchiostoma lanceolatum]|uniref:coadhesin-like n=1 Tax=Branchiostoma lanceolatum TaxID=7740 RepID=UPI003451DDDF
MRTYVGIILTVVVLLIASPVDAGKRKKNPKCDPLTLRNCDCASDCTTKDGTHLTAAPPKGYDKKTVCRCKCNFGCVRTSGAAERQCDVRPMRWKGGRGVTCSCNPCSAPPPPPLNYDSSNCTGSDFVRGTICVFECPAGYDSPAVEDRRQFCENGRWRWSVTTGCTRDGGWSDWVDGECSVTCGDGTQTRTRTCDNPAPENGGADCDGDASEVVACSEDPCPTEGMPTMMPTNAP